MTKETYRRNSLMGSYHWKVLESMTIMVGRHGARAVTESLYSKVQIAGKEN